MIPELTNRAVVPIDVDPTPVFVSRDVLRRGALNLLVGSAALWAAANVDAFVRYFDTPSFVGVPILFAVVAAAFPIQLLTLTRPLVKEVMDGSTAPASLKWVAVIALSGGSVLTALAWWCAFREMCGVA